VTHWVDEVKAVARSVDKNLYKLFKHVSMMFHSTLSLEVSQRVASASITRKRR
jgi:hypothetical protein